jgi:predicted O-methyltransferase YrrM
MYLTGRPDDLLRQIVQRCPAAGTALECSRNIPAHLLSYQAAALYELACWREGPVLDIGTFKGYSASLLAQAQPSQPVVTLNPCEAEAAEAMGYLAPWRNVTVLIAASWDVLDWYSGPDLSLVFVDGDHKQAARDVPWFDRLRVGGLLLFHDYTPAQSPHVVEAVDGLATRLGRPPDVLIVDMDGVGMAGFCRREGEIAWAMNFQS